jgi:PleD family two-component response regulator
LIRGDTDWLARYGGEKFLVVNPRPVLPEAFVSLIDFGRQ